MNHNHALRHEHEQIVREYAHGLRALNNHGTERENAPTRAEKTFVLRSRAHTEQTINRVMHHNIEQSTLMHSTATHRVGK